MTDHIKVNTHSSIRIEGSHVVYFDPWKLSEEAHDADIIFITHAHYDHYSPEDIRKVMKNLCKIIVPESMKGIVANDLGVDAGAIITAAPEKTVELDTGIKVEATAAYNSIKSFHQKKENWCGYILTLDSIRYYVAGDTDAVREMSVIQCDIALIPIGGTYTMNVNEAAKLINEMKPKVVIPTHYGSIVGNPEDGENFKKLIDPTIQVVLKL